MRGTERVGAGAPSRPARGYGVCGGAPETFQFVQLWCSKVIRTGNLITFHELLAIHCRLESFMKRMLNGLTEVASL